ncbi:hypothetical protein [Lentzea aerocolonigenes]|uniref:hypothetical protein n=1 Tax=Lentzea aerocolonigenes TaxID=68170 RepID=UPI0004C45657|nr:hypothetical protein [Lentzea aerocolonigenes]MCP2249859.1 hypothetical protein [Lentzea aerocolonigenes]
MRKLMLALSMAAVAVMGALMPATASAETTSVQPMSEFSAAADGVQLAVAGTLPPRSQLECHSVPAVEICYEKSGDHWWVQDQDSSDGASAGVLWQNIRNGSLYRQGWCMTSLGKGKWGQCNKDYYENSTLNGFPCKWDRSNNGPIICARDGWTFQ